MRSLVFGWVEICDVGGLFPVFSQDLSGFVFDFLYLLPFVCYLSFRMEVGVNF